MAPHIVELEDSALSRYATDAIRQDSARGMAVSNYQKAIDSS